MDTNQQHDEAQARKADALVRLLEGLIADVRLKRLYGDFSVSFSAQGGKIGHYEENRKSTFK